MPRIRIDVTAEHIAKGRRVSCHLCPIARAMKPVVDGRISIAEENVYGILKDRPQIQWSRRLPRRAQAFICAFDDGLPVKPFSFILTIPRAWLKEKTT